MIIIEFTIMTITMIKIMIEIIIITTVIIILIIKIRNYY